MWDPRLTAKGATLNRLTQSYVVVAISGTATIAAAIVAFVMLVSLQTIEEWPVSGLSLRTGEGGVTRATELSAPATRAAAGRSHAATPSGLPGITRVPAGAAAPGTRAAHHGQADLGGGSAIACRGDRSRGVSTGGPAATAPSLGSDSPSDAGSAAPVEPTGAGNGSGASAGSRSASGVRDAPSTDAVDTSRGQGKGHGSTAGENSGSEHAAKAPGSPNPASIKSKGPTSKSNPSTANSGPKSTPPPPTSDNAASGKGPAEPPGSHSQGNPGGPK